MRLSGKSGGAGSTFLLALIIDIKVVKIVTSFFY